MDFISTSDEIQLRIGSSVQKNRFELTQLELADHYSSFYIVETNCTFSTVSIIKFALILHVSTKNSQSFVQSQTKNPNQFFGQTMKSVLGLFFILHLFCSYYRRPAKVAGPWKENALVFGGRDMKSGREGGSWLAISTKDKTFKFGILLNIIEEEKPVDDPSIASRGSIVSNYVLSQKSNTKYCEQLAQSTENFNSFILVTIEIR